MRKHTISSSNSVIDSRDIIERLEELQSERESEVESLQEAVDSIKEEIEEAKQDVENADSEEDEDTRLKAQEALDALEEKLDEANEALEEYDFDYQSELDALEAINEKGDGYCSDWRHGETLINESYWVEYCEELCKDIGDMPKEIPSYIEIDWEKTADNLAADYTTVEWDGVSFYIRCS